MSFSRATLTQGMPLSPPRHLLNKNRRIGAAQKTDAEIVTLFKTATIFKKHLILVELLCSNFKPEAQLEAKRLIPLALSLFVSMREHKRHIFLLFLKTSKVLYPFFQEKLIEEPAFRIKQGSYLEPLNHVKKEERRTFLSNFNEMEVIDLFKQSFFDIKIKTLKNLVELSRLSNISQHQLFQGIVLKLFMELPSDDERRNFLAGLQQESKTYLFELLRAYSISAKDTPNPLGLSEEKRISLISWALAVSESSKTPMLNKQQQRFRRLHNQI